jgi:hypothetical protein
VHAAFSSIRPRLARRLLAALALASAGLGVSAALGHAESAYERAVVHETGARVEYYLRLGEPRDYSWQAEDVVGPPGGEYGWQVVTGRPGALVDDPDTAAEFLGGVADGIWESHVSPPGAPWVSGREELSVEAWVKPRALHDSAPRIFSSEDQTGGYLLAARRSGLVFARYTKAGTHRFGEDPFTGPRRTVPTRWSTVTAPVSAGTWTHVVGVYDGAAVRLYVNGVEVASQPSIFELPGSWAWRWIGSTAGGWLEWDGLLDEVAVYDGALTPDDVARHYRIGTNGAA